jgi:succinate dehydrogenase / fumarate reductase cytochrome b subunit
MKPSDAGVQRASAGTPYARPLSPFLSYRWQYSNTLSILNRITGLALVAGFVLLIYWLAAAATGEGAYANAQACFAHPLVKLLLVVFSFSFFYHLANGVRHLVWDAGYGFEKKTARVSGWIAFMGSAVLTAFFWVLVFVHMRGAA